MPVGPNWATNGPSRRARRRREAIDMQRHRLEFRCELCRRPVDDETRARARRAWQPLIVCNRCLRDAEVQCASPREPLSPAAAN